MSRTFTEAARKLASVICVDMRDFPPATVAGQCVTVVKVRVLAELEKDIVGLGTWSSCDDAVN